MKDICILLLFLLFAFVYGFLAEVTQIIKNRQCTTLDKNGECSAWVRKL